MPRMCILNKQEQAAFDLPPRFDSVQRKRFFDFSKTLLSKTNRMYTISNKIGFLLLAGYFRASRQFFQPEDFHKSDIDYIVKNFADAAACANLSNYSKTTRIRHQKIILDFYGFRPFTKTVEESLFTEIKTIIHAYLKPRLIFDRCIDFLIQNNTQLPSSFTLTELIRKGLQDQKNELILLVNHHISIEVQQFLDDLFTTSNEKNRYKLTLLKKLSQSIKPTQVRECVSDYETLSELYKHVEPVMSAINLNHAGINYYAGSVIRSRIFQLQRRTDTDRYLHLCAFIAHQYYRIQDNLIDMLLSVVASFQSNVLRQQKEYVFEQRKTQNERLRIVLGNLENSHISALHNIQMITDDTGITDQQKIIQIRELLKKANNNPFDVLRLELDNSSTDKSYYQTLEERSLRLQKRLSPILKSLNFQHANSNSLLVQAIEHFKSRDGSITDKAPLGFLNINDRQAVTKTDGSLKTSLYKVLLFLHVAHGVKSGQLNLVHSYKYRSIDEYQINRERWKRDKEQLIERAGLQEFVDPYAILKCLENVLYQQYSTTNTRIKNDENMHLKLKPNGKFTVTTPAPYATPKIIF